ncbi:response regulator transcription factor [Alloactinosynnema sp. L-07]|uniref:response regulator transcription factor n=1 Tax=Alloactinosynnema sp. L-07 TaxID=1653480 RepID=UPI0006B60F4F|nr:response regulator transcription factor [Alloactinosynnema sp. L-07]
MFEHPHSRYLELIRQSVGGPPFQKAFAEARALPSDLAMHFALVEDTDEPSVESGRLDLLTKREFEIARLVAEGTDQPGDRRQAHDPQAHRRGHVAHTLTKLEYTTRARSLSGSRAPAGRQRLTRHATARPRGVRRRATGLRGYCIQERAPTPPSAPVQNRSR